MRTAARTDRNQSKIIRILSWADGAEVFEIKQPADLIVAYGRKFVVVEVKRPLAPGVAKSDLRMTEPEREYYRAICNSAPYAVIQTELQAAQLLDSMAKSEAECFAWCLERTRAWAIQVGDPVATAIPAKVPDLGKFALTRRPMSCENLPQFDLT